MKKAKVVIGSAYGDEAKGVFTDYLSSKTKESLVIRFNGGAQAGHTVMTPDGKRHVFGHFGANSFLPNSKTALSKHFVVNPLLFAKEKKLLNDMDVEPKVFVHEDAPITTPYEMIINQWQEDSRGSNRHGSCGVGFGETLQREESGIVSLKVKDIFDGDLNGKLMEVRNYFLARVEELGLESNFEKYDFVVKNLFLEKFRDDCGRILKSLTMFNSELPLSENIVFEGAQGLLLDQKFGFFPHVTRSNTGLKNVIQIAREYGISELDVLYATRCYTTRHGRGPLKNELGSKPYEKIVDFTNIPNEYQESLRFAYLDLNVLKDSIEKDINSVDLRGINLKKYIGISCLDQTKTVKYYQNNELLEISNKDFAKYVSESFFAPVLESWKGDRENIKELI